MKRADKRTPRDVAIQRLTMLMDLPDRDLCQRDHKTGALPAPHQPCGAEDHAGGGVILVCQNPGEWASFRPVAGTRRACTVHAAATIRARLWLQRRYLQLNLNGDT